MIQTHHVDPKTLRKYDQPAQQLEESSATFLGLYQWWALPRMGSTKTNSYTQARQGASQKTLRSEQTPHGPGIGLSGTGGNPLHRLLALSRSKGLFDASAERLQTRKPRFNLRVASRSLHCARQPALVDVGRFSAQNVQDERFKHRVLEERGQLSAEDAGRGLQLAEVLIVEQIRVALGDPLQPRVVEVLKEEAQVLRISGSFSGALVPREEF